MATSDYTPTKTCSKCGEVHPATTEYFYRARSNNLRPECKECTKKEKKLYREKTEYDKKKYWNNRETELARNRAYYAKIKAAKPPRKLKTPEEYAAYKRDWYYKHRDLCIERTRQQYQSNIEYKKDWAKKYRETNKDKIKASKSAAKSLRRARMAKAEGSHTKKDILELIYLQEYRCAYCGITLYDDYQVDHIMPISRGGANSPDNLCIACGDCNNSKKNKTPEEWARVRGW